MDKLLEVIASLLKEKGLNKTGVFILVGVFFLISALSSWASLSWKDTNLITYIGSLSFCVFSIAVLLGILGYAQKTYDIANLGEIGPISEEIREIASSVGIKLNSVFESTEMDIKDGVLSEKWEYNRSYFMKERGKTNMSNFTGIWILSNGKQYKVYQWKTEKDEHFVKELWNDLKTIKNNLLQNKGWEKVKNCKDL